jgi:hypothetical protein
MGKHFYTLPFMIFISMAATSQAQKLAGFETLNIGYYGHLGLHPGVFASADYPITSKIINRNHRKGIKVVSRTWIAVPGLSFYHQVGNQNVFSPGIDMINRRETDKLFFRSIGLGPKMMVGFNAGETYVFKSNGEWRRKKIAASFHFALNTNYTVGWKLNKRTQNPPRVYMRLHSGWMFNYNQTIVPSVNLEIGFKQPISSFANHENISK